MDKRYSLTHNRSNYIIPIGHMVYIGPAVNVNILMNKWAEQILFLLSSILILVFLSLGMFVSVLAELAMNK